MRRRTHGLTLPELVLALALTAVTGLAVTGVSAALSHAYSQSQEFHQYLQTARSIVHRVQDLFRNAKLVPSLNAQNTVVWAADANRDKEINLDEIIVLHCQPGTGELVEYRVAFPDDMDAATREALNVPKPLSSLTNPDTVWDEIRTHAHCDARTLGQNVLVFRIAVRPDAPLSQIASVTLTVGEGQKTVSLRTAASLRADATDRVGQAQDGSYVLNM